MKADKERAMAIFTAIVNGSTLTEQAQVYGLCNERIRTIFQWGRRHVSDNTMSLGELYEYGYDIRSTQEHREYWLERVRIHMGNGNAV